MAQRSSTAEWLAKQYIPGFSTRARPSVTPRAFRTYGHHVARRLGGTFVEDPRPGISKNHEIALLTLSDVTTRVLLHHEIPLLAFAAYREEGEGYGGYDYIDAPHLAGAFGDTFAPASKDVLKKPIDLRALERALGKNRDIDHWKPKCIGDIWYNFWD